MNCVMVIRLLYLVRYMCVRIYAKQKYIDTYTYPHSAFFIHDTDDGDIVRKISTKSELTDKHEDILKMGKSFKDIAEKIYLAGAKSERGDGLAFDIGETDDDGSFEYYNTLIIK